MCAENSERRCTRGAENQHFVSFTGASECLYACNLHTTLVCLKLLTIFHFIEYHNGTTQGSYNRKPVLSLTLLYMFQDRDNKFSNFIVSGAQVTICSFPLLITSSIAWF